MTPEEFEAKLTEMIKLGKELGYEVGVMLNTDRDTENIEGIIMGTTTFVQSAMQYMQLDSFLASMGLTETKVPQLPEPENKVSDTKPTHKPKKTEDDDGGPTWH